MRYFCHIFMFLSCILVLQTAKADWNDITILQDAEISEGDQYVRVFVHSPNAPTTVDVTGGQIGTLFAFDNSIINVTGGTFNPEYYTYHPENNDGDSLFLAPSRHRIYMEDFSVLNYYGADLQGGIQSTVLCADQSTTNIFDGSVFLEIANKSEINIAGGKIKGITETEFFSPIPQKHPSHLSIWGGCFSGKVSLMRDSVADIYGYGFEYDPNGWVNENPRFKGTEGGQLRGFWADGTAFSMDFVDHFSHSYSQVVLHEVPRRIQVDIKPQSCPNILNVKSKGVFEVAILGADNFDVVDIDVTALSLEGIAPLRNHYKDETTPVINGQECECDSKKKDGFLDLIIKFDTEQVIDALSEIEEGQEWLLRLMGSLYDGTAIEGSDCILIKKKGNQ